MPAEPVIDGRDLSPVLFGTSKESPREAHYYFSGYNLQAVRQGPWKLAIAPQTDAVGQDHRGDSKTNPRLYNLDTDIGETTNVADKHPEVVEKLKALAAKMSDEIGGQKPKARRPAGVVADPKPLYPIDEAPKAKDDAKPAALDKLKPGDAVPSAAAPQIGGQGVHADVPGRNRTARHGDRGPRWERGRVRAAPEDGRVVFSVRTGRRTRSPKSSRNRSRERCGSRRRSAKDGAMTLTVGEQAAVEREGPGADPPTAAGGLLPRPRQRPARRGVLEGQAVRGEDHRAEGDRPVTRRITRGFRLRFPRRTAFSQASAPAT